MPGGDGLPPVLLDWYNGRGWSVRPHQAAMLAAARAERHALLVAPTGSGKTLAGFTASLAELIEAPPILSISPHLGREKRAAIHTLYVSPLKALAVDVQRNLLAPIAEMGLDIRVETRTGDTPPERKARQKVRPPHMLLTTPESLSLLLSHPDSFTLFAGLRTAIVDEVHAFASSKRGDLLALSLARLQRIAPTMRRVALSATVADPDAYRAWLAPGGDKETVDLVTGDPGARAEIAILLPEDERIPWSGHSGRWATEAVMREIEAHRTSLIFCNTRSLAELIFQDLWAVNASNLPIGIHHGSLSREARRKVEAAVAAGRLRALVCTSSLDLGVDWGDVDLVIQMGAPKGASRLLQRVGRANHRLDEPSKAILVPGNRFEFLEARAALDSIDEGVLDPEHFRPGGIDVLAQHVLALACAAPFTEAELLDELRAATPYADLTAGQLGRLLAFIESGGYALRAYDRFRRLVREANGTWRVAHPRFVRQHRMNAGIIVEAPLLNVRFRGGRKLGTVEEYFASTLAPGDTFYFAGLSLEVEAIRGTDLVVRASSKPARIPTYGGARMAMTTNLADRVRAFLHDRTQWLRFPAAVREWLEVQDLRSLLPRPDQLLVETFPHEHRHYMVAYCFEGWNAHQSLGMLVTRRMETRGLRPLGFVASDYALACYGLDPITDPASLFAPDILEDEFVEWVESSHLLKRAFRDVAVISGLVERHHPGQRKSGRQVTFSTDLIYDVLRRYEPDHLLLGAAWHDARERLTDVDRLARLLEGAQGRMVHATLERVSPMAVPVLIMIGRERTAQGTADDALLIEAEALAEIAMRRG